MVAAVSDSSAAEACRVGAADLVTAGLTLILTQSGPRALRINTLWGLVWQNKYTRVVSCVKIADR